MCGIAGLMSAGSAEALAAAAGRMADALVHRGPDEGGTWSDGVVGFGHRRLSIIDLADGQQPMRSDSGCVLTYNGEIFNYLEIRDELAAAGTRFHTHSDTEVVLKAYEAWGEACVERFNGMFAFALWNPRTGRLFLARDRLGKKPLYFAFGAGGFAFASEIKALLTLPWVRDAATPDPCALVDFLTLGYVLTPKTAFANIQRLPAAHRATLAPGDGTLAASEYWRLDAVAGRAEIPYAAAARDRFAALLDDAVRLRLRADVPVGVYLSGGLDSSAIAAIAVRHGGDAVRAYTVSFSDARFDEAPHARGVARHLGMAIDTIPCGAPTPDLVPRLAWQADEPFSDTSSAPTYLLNRAAAGHVKVALSGDGCDEILAGYPTYKADRYYQVYRRVPAPLRGLLRGLASVLPPSYRKLSFDYKLRQFLSADGLSRERAHYWWRTVFPPDEVAALLGDGARAAAAGYDPYDTFDGYFRRVADGGASFLRRSQYVDVKTWLQDDILVKADRFSMAHSVEVRSPFLDHRLVELSLALADDAKMGPGGQKTILRDLMSAQLPPSILKRPKEGFGAPTRHLGAVSVASARPDLVNPAFTLDPAREDVTYKSFALTILQEWLTLFDGYGRTGEWRRP